MDAEDLPEVFGKNEVATIYLNFSDPWPKDRHAKRRLPSREFLARYDQILKPEGKVEFKTDNRGLFDFALEEVKEAGWKLEVCTFDLHHDEELMKGNIMTEYEERFSKKGNPICKFILERDPNADREAMARAQKDLEREAVLRQDAERAFEARKDGENVK